MIYPNFIKLNVIKTDNINNKKYHDYVFNMIDIYIYI